jgi:hypothetical protein
VADGERSVTRTSKGIHRADQLMMTTKNNKKREKERKCPRLTNWVKQQSLIVAQYYG